MRSFATHIKPVWVIKALRSLDDELGEQLDSVTVPVNSYGTARTSLQPSP